MKLEYTSATLKYTDTDVTSVVGSNGDILIFTSEYGPHHKYMISGNTIRRYELSCSFFRVLPITAWRVTAE